MMFLSSIGWIGDTYSVGKTGVNKNLSGYSYLDWKACFLQCLRFEKKVCNAKGLLANQMIGFRLPGAKTHSK